MTRRDDFGRARWTREEIAAWKAQHDAECRERMEADVRGGMFAPARVHLDRLVRVPCRAGCDCGCATYNGSDR